MGETIFSHLDEKGNARMVDITGKEETIREALAEAHVVMSHETLSLIMDGKISKGDVYSVARIAAIMAAKKTGELIPLCHPLDITGIEINFIPCPEKGEIVIRSLVRTRGRTGVEMEAMTAASIAALTIYDMCKGVDKTITITQIALLAKQGGKSGDFVRPVQRG